MSIIAVILAAASATTMAATTRSAAPAPRASESLVPAIGLLIFGLGGAAFARVFRPRSIEGPLRVGPETSVLPLLLTTLIGGGVWMGVQVAYAMGKHAQFQVAHPGEKFSIEQLSTADFAFLAIVPAAIGLGILLAGDLWGKLVGKLGYGFWKIPRGIVQGVIGMFIALPIVWSGTIFLSIVYEAFRVPHPAEHELLKVMKEAGPGVRWMLVVGACVAAPVFEEMLFRGHLQTLLVRLMAKSPPPLPVTILPPLGELVEEGDATPPLEYKTPQTEGLEYAPPPAPRWVPVLLTSFLFAIVHPLWMAPAIFVLSVCLGYAYERTGKLWVPILIHAAFNSTSTLVFLNPP